MKMTAINNRHHHFNQHELGDLEPVDVPFDRVSR